jgi:predicted Rossmann fold nucleotide-binding protein DprA/Smf involved in DNA uptake
MTTYDDARPLPTDALGAPHVAALGADAPATVWALGDVAVLRQPTLALVSSVRVPGDAIIAMYDLARNLRDAGVTVVGGFHSPMEQECLRLLLRGTQGVVVCPARGVEKMRVPAA